MDWLGGDPGYREIALAAMWAPGLVEDGGTHRWLFFAGLARCWMLVVKWQAECVSSRWSAEIVMAGGTLKYGHGEERAETRSRAARADRAPREEEEERCSAGA